MTTPEHRRQLSHVLRRLQFAAWPGQVEELEDLTLEEAAATIIERDTPFIPTDEVYEKYEAEVDEGSWDAIVLWYMDRLADSNAGLHERMVWFWHGHLTSNVDKSKDIHMLRQDRLFREHALGNFRTLLQAVTVDAAMLHWLDGDDSYGDAPNENYAREMMELFALGVGNYVEDDIRAAARGLTGWHVDYETKEVYFEAEHHYSRPTRFLGERRKWDATSIVDKVCDQPACARHVAGAVYWHLVGEMPSTQDHDTLAKIFRGADLEMLPLVQAIVALPAFIAAQPARARTAVEWTVATMAALGPEQIPLEQWWLEQMGQVPFYPPNVAGWAKDDRWVSASQVLARTAVLLEPELSDKIINTVEPSVDSVLAHCGLFDVSETTRAAMQSALDEQTEFDYGLELLFVLALSSPEFAYV